MIKIQLYFQTFHFFAFYLDLEILSISSRISTGFMVYALIISFMKTPCFMENQKNYLIFRCEHEQKNIKKSLLSFFTRLWINIRSPVSLEEWRVRNSCKTNKSWLFLQCFRNSLRNRCLPRSRWSLQQKYKPFWSRMGIFHLIHSDHFDNPLFDLF